MSADILVRMGAQREKTEERRRLPRSSFVLDKDWSALCALADRDVRAASSVFLNVIPVHPGVRLGAVARLEEDVFVGFSGHHLDAR